MSDKKLPLDTPLFPVIEKCLKKDPGDRYRSFKQIRPELESVWKNVFLQSLLIVPEEAPSAASIEGLRRLGFGRALRGIGEGANAKVNLSLPKKLSSASCELDPDDPHQWFMLGEVRISRRDREGAEEAFKRARALGSK